MIENQSRHWIEIEGGRVAALIEGPERAARLVPAARRSFNAERGRPSARSEPSPRPDIWPMPWTCGALANRTVPRLTAHLASASA